MSIEIKNIVNGPSKEALKNALFERAPQVQKVTFSIEKGIAQEVTIFRVEAEDNSGESWNIFGEARAKIEGSKLVLLRKRVNIHFRTKNRKGTMTFLN